MKKAFHKIVAASLVLFGLASFALVTQPSLPTMALGANQKAVCESLGNANCDDTDNRGGTRINSVISTAIDLFSIIVGIVAVIMIITAGFKYITSAGDSSKLTSAKNTLVYAIIGLVIVALSQGIVKLVLNKTALPPCPDGQVRDANGPGCHMVVKKL